MADITLSTDATLPGLRIAAGDRYIFNPANDITLTIDVNQAETTPSYRNNIIVEGELQMRPNSNRTHIIQFTGINTTLMVGGTGFMSNPTNPPTTDAGVWVVGAGKLNLQGNTKVAWNRTGNDATWAGGDEVRSVPWGYTGADQRTVDLTTTNTFVPGVDTPGTFDPWGDTSLRQYQEICNLTRNVQINGVVNAEAHVLIMSTQPQTINYVSMRWMGPSGIPGTHFGNTANAASEFSGSYALHFHMAGDGSRGSSTNGIVIRDGRGRAFVHHRSHGLHWYDCLSWRQNAGGFWYDPEEVAATDGGNAPDDLTIEHCGCVVNGVNVYLQDSVAGNCRNHIFDSFAAGQTSVSSSTGSGAPGYWDWTNKAFVGTSGSPTKGEVDQPGDIWDWHDNVAHNYGNLALRVWQNEANQHVLRGATAFWGKWKDLNFDRDDGAGGVGSVSLGAYNNNYDIYDSLFQGGVWDASASSDDQNPDSLNMDGISAIPGKNWVRCHFNRLRIGTHVGVAKITRFVDCTYHEFVTAEDSKPFTAGSCRHHDFVRGNIGPMDPTGTVLVFNGGLNAQSEYRFQDVNGNAWRLVHPVGLASVPTPYTYESIAPFALWITTPSLPPATINSAYTPQTLAYQFGAASPWTSTFKDWELVSGTLPTGMTFSAGGVISGTPTQSGTFPLQFRVRDSANNSADRTLSLVVGAVALLTITTTSLPSGAIGTAYSQTLARTGGTGPFTWSLVSGLLPDGLTLSSAGVISGTPTFEQTAIFTVRVTDSVASTDDQVLSIQVQNLNPNIDQTTLAAGETGASYTQQLSASGGTPPYTWSVFSGTLPAGITMSSLGTFTGVPTTAATSNFTIRVTDAAARTDDQAFSILIVTPPPPLEMNPHADIAAFQNRFYWDSFSATGGTAPYEFLISGAPEGIALDTDGIMAGSPLESGVFLISIAVKDAADRVNLIQPTMSIEAQDTLFTRPVAGERLVTLPGHVIEMEVATEELDTMARATAKGVQNLLASATGFVLTSAFTMTDALYQAVLAPSWQTTWTISGKSTTGFTVTFGIPVPVGGGTCGWRVR